ncbi:MAG: ABC transporter permease [Coriobacteriaceae bacterium]|jgi:putative spermidine/putrescine transport system permease protein|nr:MAG: ABC transporter permease [Coriobacteriaceae bacterium]
MQNKRLFAYALMLPCAAFITLFLLIPMFATFISTVTGTGAFSLDGYWQTLADTYFQQVFWRTIRLSLITVAICILLGFPAAYYVARVAKKKSLFIAMTLFPLMTSPVVRSFSWMVLLGKKGTANTLLQSLGIISSPIPMLYNEFSIVVGLVQLFLPLMIISTVGVMENIDEDLMLASNSLGASRTTSFWRIMFPLSVPGLITGSVLVFCGSLTAYTTPQLLGGSDTRMLATLIYQDGLSLNDWTAASVVAIIMIVIAVVATLLIGKLARKVNPAAA